MRVVSQDGMIDIPYDMYVVYIDYRNKKRIMAMSAVGMGEDEMATYSTEAKAIKAMKMLREAYTGRLICQNVDLSDDKVVELLKNWNMQAITVVNSDTTSVDYINNTVFRFPTDEDVEVDNE